MQPDAAGARVARALKGHVARCFRATPRARVGCVICQDEGRWGIRLACGHEYHLCCIARWHRVEPRCPLCREDVVDARLSRCASEFAQLAQCAQAPIESMLRFDTAPSLLTVQLFQSVQCDDVFDLVARLRRVERRGYVSSHVMARVVAFVEALALLVLKIREYDAHAPPVPTRPLHADGLVDDEIRRCARRLCKPYADVAGRTTEPWSEMHVINLVDDATVRKLLQMRLCRLWALERECHALRRAQRRAVFFDDDDDGVRA